MDQIDHAATLYVATVKPDTVEKIKTGSFDEFFEARQEYKLGLIGRMENYLRSDAFDKLDGNAQLDTRTGARRYYDASDRSMAIGQARTMRELWAMQTEISALGTIIASLAGFVLGFVWIYMAKHDVVRRGWRTFEFLHSAVIAGYWIVAAFCFLLAACGLLIVFLKLFRRSDRRS